MNKEKICVESVYKMDFINEICKLQAEREHYNKLVIKFGMNNMYLEKLCEIDSQIKKLQEERFA